MSAVSGFSPDLFARRRVVVTGAAGGIGGSICQAFAAAGADVIGIDRVEAPGIVACDLADRRQVEEIGRRIGAAGPVAALVHCAGRFRRVPVISAEAGDELDACLMLHVSAPFALTRALLPVLREGAVVTITSTSAERASVDALAYSTSKAALRAMTAALAAELAPMAIRVNAVAPGEVATALTAGDERVEKLVGRTPMRRRARPEEVAAAVVFLASPLASFVTGTTLAVDGGYLTI